MGSEEDAKLLASLGVDYFQGYYFGEPDISPEWMNSESEAGNQKPEIGNSQLKIGSGF